MKNVCDTNQKMTAQLNEGCPVVALTVGETHATCRQVLSLLMCIDVDEWNMMDPACCERVGEPGW